MKFQSYLPQSLLGRYIILNKIKNAVIVLKNAVIILTLIESNKVNLER